MNCSLAYCYMQPYHSLPSPSSVIVILSVFIEVLLSLQIPCKPPNRSYSSVHRISMLMFHWLNYTTNERISLKHQLCPSALAYLVNIHCSAKSGFSICVLCKEPPTIHGKDMLYKPYTVLYHDSSVFFNSILGHTWAMKWFSLKSHNCPLKQRIYWSRNDTISYYERDLTLLSSTRMPRWGQFNHNLKPKWEQTC